MPPATSTTGERAVAPAPLDLDIYIGDTTTVTVTVKNAGTPVNITGRTYAAQIRKTPGSTSILATLTCTITNAAGGVVVATLPASVSTALTPQRASWDLQEITPSSPENVVQTLVAGYANISQDVTR